MDWAFHKAGGWVAEKPLRVKNKSVWFWGGQPLAPVADFLRVGESVRARRVAAKLVGRLEAAPGQNAATEAFVSGRVLMLGNEYHADKDVVDAEGAQSEVGEEGFHAGGGTVMGTGDT